VLEHRRLAELAAVSTCRAYTQGTQIDQPGEGQADAPLVVSGEVSASYVSLDGQELPVFVLERGEVFKFGAGGEAILDAMVAVATAPSTLICRLPWHIFVQSVMTCEEAGAMLVEQLDQRSEQIGAAASDRMHPAEIRLRRILWRDALHSKSQSVFFTHEHLARRAGTTRARVTNLLAKLADQRLIECEARSHRITVLELERLASED
jgi:CRP-like cAMP-binding protein